MVQAEGTLNSYGIARRNPSNHEAKHGGWGDLGVECGERNLNTVPAPSTEDTSPLRAWRLLSGSAKLFAAKAAIIASIGGLLFGYDIGIVEGALPQLRADMHLHLGQQDMVVAVMVVGAISGSTVAGFFADQLGRWTTIVLTDLIFMTGGVILYLAEDPAGWRIMFGLSTVLAALQLLGMAFMPFSPRWLIIKGRRDEALDVLIKIRNSQDEAEAELREIELNDPEAKSSIRELLTKWSVPLMITTTLAIFQQLSGHANVLNFTEDIFEGSGFEGPAPAVILGIVKVIATIVAIMWVDHFGRKPFLLWGAFGITCSLLAISVGSALSSPQVSFVACCVLVAAYALSFGPVTWLVTAEMFPPGIRGKALGIGQVGSFVGNLAASSFFLRLLHTAGGEYTFLMFACIAFTSTLFIAAFVPETKGKEPAQIAQGLPRAVCAVSSCPSYTMVEDDE
ncbi:unnamed protein product [Ascophyllum nodosum]